MLRDANPSDFAGIYIVCGRTDMRLGMDSLATIIENRYLLLTKRVEDGHFSWPRNSSEARRLDARQFDWLMKGFSIDPVIREHHPSRSA